MRSNLREALMGMKKKIRHARGKSYADKGGSFDVAAGVEGDSGGSNTDKPGKDLSIFAMPGKSAGGKPVAEAQKSAKADMLLAGKGMSDEKDEAVDDEFSSFMKRGPKSTQKPKKAISIVVADVRADQNGKGKKKKG